MSDWRRIALGDLAKPDGCTIQTGPFGSQLHKHEYQAEGIGVVNPTHMANRRVSHASVPCVSAEVAARLMGSAGRVIQCHDASAIQFHRRT